MGPTKLQKRSGIALWRQIADDIRLKASGGLADENGRLPGEIALAEQFSVNRHTIRTAIQALASEGLVETRHGDGTYLLSRNPIIYTMGRRTRFSQGIGPQAKQKKLSVLATKTDVAHEKLAHLLDIKIGSSITIVELISRADDTALSLSTNYFPSEQFSGIERHIEETGSITEAFKHFGINEYERAKTDISACHANDSELKHLSLAPGAIVLSAKSINSNSAKQPIQYAETRFSADRVTLSVDH